MKPEPTFLDGRRAFEGTYSNITKGRDNWRLVGLISLCLLAFETATLCRLALTSRFTPYVVEVDQLGRAVAFGPPSRSERPITGSSSPSSPGSFRASAPSTPTRRRRGTRFYAPTST